MKNVPVTHTVKLQQNTTKRPANFLTIKCSLTGKVLHRGQPAYIKRLLAQKYGGKV